MDYGELKHELSQLLYSWQAHAKKHAKGQKAKDLWFEVESVLMDAVTNLNAVVEESEDDES